jgi:hypothetical protein
MLKKMKMPKREEISVDELDMEMPEGGMPAEGSEEAPSADEGKMADLAAISDEDLLAEMKKRGLMGEMAGDEEMEMAEGGEEDLEEYDDEEMMG